MKKILIITIVFPVFSKCFSQNVGIGTTTPAFKLDVRSGSINTDSVYRIGTYPVISIQGINNFFAGRNAALSNTGKNNTAIGEEALSVSNTGDGNTALGATALFFNTIGANNTASGNESLFYNTSGDKNSAIGSLSLFNNDIGSNNAAIGYQALYSNNGSGNVALGTQALFLNTTGSGNTALGLVTLQKNITGSYNTAVGFYADVASANLTYATAIGSNALVGCSHCLALGGTTVYHSYVGINNNTPLTDLHIIQYTDAGGDKLRGIRLQRSINTNHWRTLIDPSNNYVFEFNDNLYTYINPTTGAYINPSDVRLKKDITPLRNMLDKVMALTPEKFHYKTNKESDPLLWGFIAQDVQKIFPEFVDVKDDGYLGIAYSNFSIVAIKAIQEQQAEIEELRKEHQAEKGQIKKLQDQNEQTESKYNELRKEIEELKTKINH
ncbi:MAG: tail fiber domain-containing protein [Ginsengibacter sp.]